MDVNLALGEISPSLALSKDSLFLNVSKFYNSDGPGANLAK
jgi:hypothetical protein